ncbi:MAG: hypothetical protein ACRDE6_07060, partial [Candidatus Limnocylindria bacterium]
MKRTLPGLIIVLFALAACAAPGASPPGSTGASPDPSNAPPTDAETGAIEHPTGSEPILVVSSAGGFVMVQFVATQLPS